MKKELAKQYDPQATEKDIYQYWENKECFKAVIDQNKTPYCIMMPPPNITGQLHMGHALDNVLQDALIRHKRMQGYCALWLPGTDHASIATETKIVAAMKEEGLTKEDIGREKFLARAWKWKDQYAGRILEQLKSLGSSCDWSRLRFTMDEGCSNAVKEAFIKYYNEDIIYRGNRIINWCPCCKTSISEAEVEYEERAGHLWHLRYRVKDSDDYLELATTRPETMLGDTAVAVNPQDERYQKYVGKTVILPIVGRELPVVADDYVDIEFGTGVGKDHPRPRPQRLRSRAPARAGSDRRIHRRCAHRRGLRAVFRHGCDGSEESHRKEAGRRRRAGKDRGLCAQRRHLLPLPFHH